MEVKLVRNWQGTNWTTFKSRLESCSLSIPEVITHKKLDRMVQSLYSAIEGALDEASPKFIPSGNTKSLRWFQGEHHALSKKLTEAYKKAIKSKSPRDMEHYKTLKKEYKKKCHKDRNINWREFKASIEEVTDMVILNKVAQKKERHSLNTLEVNGEHTLPGTETIQALINYHFPSHSEVPHYTYNSTHSVLLDELQDQFSTWVNIPTIRAAMDKFIPKKSPGPDGLPPVIFKYLPESILFFLMQTYKACIKLQYTPLAWRKARVIFIPKPGKNSYTEPKAFRPISLSNYLLKTLERLVVWKMDTCLYDHPIHVKQYGFLSHKSTESAISNTVDYIESFMLRGQFCVGVFLDISSAFNSMLPDQIRDSLIQHGGPTDMVEWYHNYVKDRHLEVELHSHKMVVKDSVGFPQGGVASAKLWLVAFNRAIEIINKYQIQGNGFADDCSAVLGGKSLPAIIIQLQAMLDELTTWGRTCGLYFNPDKTQVVLFSRRNIEKSHFLRMDGQRIPYSTSTKYLGVTLDSKLRRNKHIEDKIASSKKWLMNLNNIIKDNWAPQPKIMRWAFTAIVRPALTYGALVWGHAAQRKGIQDKLRRLNRLASNMTSRIPRSTPTRALEIILNLTPLHLLIMKEALASNYRLHSVLNNDPLVTRVRNNRQPTEYRTAHLTYWRNQVDDILPINTQNNRCYNRVEDTKFKVDTSSLSDGKPDESNHGITIYTDGSKDQTAVGAGYVVNDGRDVVTTHSDKLPEHASVFQAELCALQQAALFASSINPLGRNVVIYSDSQAAIKAIQRTIIRDTTTYKTIQALNQLGNITRSLTIRWVKAHVGHPGNEKADELAKAGSRLSDVTYHNIPYSMNAIKGMICTFISNRWKLEWQKYPLAQHSKNFYSEPNANLAKEVYTLGRKNWVYL
jgi:ribonuclease HI